MTVTSDDQELDIHEVNNYERFLVKDDAIEFQLSISKSPKKSSVHFNFTFTTESGSAKTKTKAAVFEYCPFGYSFNNSKCRWNSVKNAPNGIAYHRGNHVYVYANLWFHPSLKELSQDEEKGIQCPKNYCRKCNATSKGENENYCLFKQDNQCKEGRDQSSMLCSKCKNGTVVEWGSEKCIPCSTKTYIMVLKGILMYFLNFVLVGALIIFDISIYSSCFNSVLFFYQVIGLFVTTAQKLTGINHIISIANLEGFGDVTSNGFFVFCYSGSNNLYKPLYNIALIVITILNLIIWILISSRYSVRFLDYQRVKGNGYRATAFIILFMYGSLVRVTLTAIQPIIINNSARVFIYADMKYDSYHAGFISYGLALLILLLFPVTMCFNWSCHHYHRHLYDTFKTPFKKGLRQRFGATYYLFCRFLIDFCNTVLVCVETQKQLMLSVLAMMSVIILIIFALVKPYKSGFLNTFDTFVLFLISFIAVISNGKQKISVLDSANDDLEKVVLGFLFLPVLFFGFINCIRLVKYCCVFYQLKMADFTAQSAAENERRVGEEERVDGDDDNQRLIQ
jgi:hypothetical protein